MSWSYTSAIAYALPIVVTKYQSGHRCLDEPFDILGYEDADTLAGELKAAATSLLGEGHGISIKYFEMKYEPHCSMMNTSRETAMYLVYEPSYYEDYMREDCLENYVECYALDLSVPQDVNRKFEMLLDAFSLTAKCRPGWYKIACFSGLCK